MFSVTGVGNSGAKGTIVSNEQRRKIGRPRKRSAGEQRALVIPAARKVFINNGLRAATMEQIAGEAGVSRQSVYEEFGNKNALFDAVLNDVLAEAGKSFRRLEREDVADQASATRRFADVVSYYRSHPEHLQMIREGDRQAHPAVAEYHRTVAEGHAASLRSYWASMGNGLDSGPLADLVANLGNALVYAIVDLPWSELPQNIEATSELVTAFTNGGIRALLKQAPEMLEQWNQE